MNAIGMMSGTSLDGITVALVSTMPDGADFKVIAFKTYPFAKDIKEKIKNTIENGKTESLAYMNFLIGKLYAETLTTFIKEFEIERSKIYAVGMHGQTVFHSTEKFPFPVTLQIGEPAFVAYESGIDTVANFRAKDIAAGGQGAPLIPFFDFLIFSKYGKNFAVQNLGGIGNVTYVPKNKNGVMAFDTGPCNMLLDSATEMLFGKEFDRNGEIAAKGNIIEPLLKELKAHPYLSKKPPKSTGRSEFGTEFTKQILKKFENKKKEDIIATLNFFVAFTIKYAYEKFLGEIDTVILSGGGAKNETLVKNVRKLTGKEVVLSDKFGIPSEAKEAAAFALYAIRTKMKLPSNLPNATGAKRKAIIGEITYAD